jgi:hypothetical protein
MARDTVLVIGAGASYGARPDAPRPPLGRGLGQYLLDWYDANAPRDSDPVWSVQMRNPLSFDSPGMALFRPDPDVRPTLVRAAELCKTSNTGFEHVMDELLHEEHRRLLDKVNLVICFALLGGRACAFERKVDLYDQLFTIVRPALRCIITPNYDLLDAEALERVGLKYRYRGATDPASDGDADVVLDKTHGAVNLFLPSGAGRGSTEEAARASARPLKVMRQKRVLSYYNDHGVHASIGDGRKNAVAELKIGMSSPVLVTYGPGKDSTYGRPFLEQVRAECAADLRDHTPRRVIAIGISPPRGDGDDDAWQRLCTLLGSLACAKDYWSGVAEEREKMRACGFDVHDGYFEHLLRALEAEPSVQ